MSHDNQELAVPFGKAIKTFRMGRRLTQPELAAMVPEGLTQGHLSKIENGACFPRNKVVRGLIRALGCSSEELWAMVETFAERGLGRKDKVSYRDCITHEALNLDSHRLRTIKALLDGNVAMDEIVHLKRNLSVASSVKTLKNKMVIRKLRVLIEDLPLESIEQARAFSRLLGLLLETACSPQGTEPRGTETVVPTI